MKTTPAFAIVAALAVFPGTCWLAAASPAGAENARVESTAGKLRVLVVTGGHDYDAPAFDRMFAADTGVEYRHEAHPKALETIASAAARELDAILLYDMWQPISEEQKARYSALVRGGMGIVALHHTLGSFQDWPEYEGIVGGKFFLGKHLEGGVEAPPSGYRHDLDIPVEVAGADHFVTRGLKDFVIHDETYSRFRVDPASHVLLRTKHPESGPVIGWTQPYGKARVVYIQLGHDDGAYSSPQYRGLVSRAVRWVARRSPDDDGFSPIFNGRDLSGWKAEGKASFSVEEGMLVGRQGRRGEAGDLFTEAEFGDFELEAAWRMDFPGNSGVWFRYQGPEKAYQADILEWKDPVCWSGTVYCPSKMFLSMNTDPSIVRRDGWNTFLVRAVKDHIQVFLNGRKVSDARDASSSRGRIGFQVHAGADFGKMAIRIADIRVRRL